MHESTHEKVAMKPNSAKWQKDASSSVHNVFAGLPTARYPSTLVSRACACSSPHLATLAGVVAEHDMQRRQGGGRQPAVPPHAVRRHVLRVEVHVHHSAIHLKREGDGASVGRGSRPGEPDDAG